MVFLGIYSALYDYVPQGDNELAIREGELLYVIEKNSDDDWWKAKKKAFDEDEEEPEGLIPSNYVEEAQPTHHAKALYDYSRQTDEELSFTEDAALFVYDTSDPDWTLVGMNGEYGFAPTNYIEILDRAPTSSPHVASSARAPPQEPEPEAPATPSSLGSPTQSPAAALAGIIGRKASSSAPTAENSRASPPPSISLPPRRPAYTPEASDEEPPSPPAPELPQRPASQQYSPSPTQYASPRSPMSPEAPGVMVSPPQNRASFRKGMDDDAGFASPGRFHLYNINEMVSAMGKKKKKLPTTLGINNATGTIMIAPEKSRDGSSQEWTAEKLTHYSIEGKHVFMELIRPSKSIDFHAGAKDTAHEIVAALGEMAGAVRAEGLREVLAASHGSRGGQKQGQVLYDFMAQGDDEVTVAVGDEVMVVDDTASEEWWKVRRLKNGMEGVVPSSYVEVTGTTSAPPPSTSGINAGRSQVEQNRLEEQRLAREATKSKRHKGGSDAKGSEVGPGMRLPDRGSSLMGGDDGNRRSTQRSSKRESKPDDRAPSTSKPKPDASKTRTWTDRSASFKVEAEFIGLKDGKIHLHKLNGVKIAVPVPKMSVEDLEYVERATGVSLDDDKPLSDIRRRSTQKASGKDRRQSSATTPGPSAPAAELSADQPKQSDYDWFDFFLKCGVNPHQCERYAASFAKDSMDENVLPDIEPGVLRTLGLKEGDILRVMKHLDGQHGRTGPKGKIRNVSFGGAQVIGKEESEEQDGIVPIVEGSGGLFSGPGGALRNNTRKGRPAPTVQTNNVVDAKAFEQANGETGNKKAVMAEAIPTPLTSAPIPENKSSGGFDDDAWDVKPSRQQSVVSQAAASPPAPAPTPTPMPAQAPQPPKPTLTDSMRDLSLLSAPLPAPLQPTIAHSTGAQTYQPQFQPSAQPQQPQLTGANPSFFTQLGQQQPGASTQQNNIPQPPSLPTFNPQQTGYGQFQPQQQQMPPQQPSQPQMLPPRQRPQAPQTAQSQSSLMPPPPPRPLSAPQNLPMQNGFGPPPLQPQLTGYQNQAAYGSSIAPPGQSMNELNQMRFNQQYGQQMQPQMTGFGQQSQGFNQFGNGIAPQQTGFGQQQQQQQSPPQFGSQTSPAFLNGQQTGSPFANPPPQQPQPTGFQQMISQPTGFQSPFQPSLQPQQTGTINSFLPPAMQPQPTGQQNGFGGGAQRGFGQPPPPVPSIPQQPTIAPLQSQKTGPAPPVKFGVQGEAKRLTPQPTGRRANLSQATPQNPFGFE
ncbi:MAG: cytoskeletal protein binding protein [Pycnora praestabilis]|nr:MAG: cytoskeletal protein binding protein [Pycnora praestabilis]